MGPKKWIITGLRCLMSKTQVYIIIHHLQLPLKEGGHLPGRYTAPTTTYSCSLLHNQSDSERNSPTTAVYIVWFRINHVNFCVCVIFCFLVFDDAGITNKCKFDKNKRTMWRVLSGGGGKLCWMVETLQR